MFDDHRLLAMEHLARFEADASPADPLPERLSPSRRATWATDLDVLTRQGDEAVHIARVEGLMPGTTYAFQVRALGRLGYTDWSDSTTRMPV